MKNKKYKKITTYNELRLLKNNMTLIKTMLFPQISELTLKINFQNKIIQEIYNHYVYLLKESQLENIDITNSEYRPKTLLINVDHFGGSVKKFKRFVKQFGSLIKDYFYEDKDLIRFDEVVSKPVLDLFYKIYKESKDNTNNEIKIYDDEEINDLLETDELEETIELKESDKINLNDVINLNKNVNIDALKRYLIDVDVNQEKIKFNYNDKIERIDSFGDLEVDVLRRTDIRIIKKTNIRTNLNLLYSIVCRYCEEKLIYNEKVFNLSQLNHKCPMLPNSKGEPSIVKLDKGRLIPTLTKQMFMYEIKYMEGDEESTGYVFSFDDSIDTGDYHVNVIRHSSKSQEFKEMFIILAFERIEPKYNKDFLAIEETKEWCKKQHLEFFRPLVPLFSARKFYKDNYDIEITDMGMLFQIAYTFVLNARNFFGYRYFATSIIGDSSVSKTFPAILLGQLMDKRFFYVPKGSSMSLPGFQGGININKKFSGVFGNFFEEGLISRNSSIVFDEAQIFYDIKDRVNALFNEALKEFTNDETSISKMGGETNIPQRYTPVILSNLGTNHFLFYKEEIFKAYRMFLRVDKDFIKKYEHSDLMSITNYLNKINLFMPLEYYLFELKDKHLTQAVAFVRKTLEEKDIDWKSGGKIPASNRILFDVLVENRATDKNNNNIPNYSYGFNGIKFSKLMPTDSFIKTHAEYFKIPDKTNYLKPDPLMKEQIKSLIKNIIDFFKNDEKGKKIMLHFTSLRTKKVDDKIFGMMIDLMVQSQILQSRKSTELSPVTKKFFYWFFLKLKRGITIDEYNFEDHSYTPTIDFRNEETLELRNLESLYVEAVEIVKNDKKIKEVEQEEEILGEDNSMKDYFIDLEEYPEVLPYND